MSRADVLISVQNVGVRFKTGKSLFSRDTVEALRDVSFNLYRGDSLGVIGRNGAGKSTMLKLLGGIIKPDSGRVINNNATTSLLALQIGFDQELSGRVNAVLSGMLLGFRKHDVEDNLEKIIAFSELGDFIDRPVKSYSAGMRARLGFSVALEMNPEVLLVDEVLGVGDVEFRKKSMAVMKAKLVSEQTIVLVSHDARTVKTLCNRAVWIEDGITRMEGSAEDVVTAYEDFIQANAGRSRK
jgi:lipopolysaccharide transport system ATP-binding protein